MSDNISTEKKAYTLELEPKIYSWCTCGLSQKLPFCDSSHRGTEFRSHKFEITEAQTVTLCGCSQTSTPPYCDGTFKNCAK
ncbi:CDGSH iron-sulfur domain-containing protein [bacterium]|nr:MAG: CDGSH iron-sulfur domain-containing protein [bacterium]